MNPVEQLNASLAGRYEIVREIGAGGMATVYLARDRKHDRNVALKVLRPELGAVLGTDRFLSEIRVTANLQHPHLLPLFDSGEANGLLFYVMPYVQGETLRDRLERERQLPVDEAIRIATAVASALHYAHKHGVIHRDLKPENILLQEGQPVVSDFGIALAVTNAGGARITQTGLSLGTPQYMSPEQATGDRQIDARTDIYSLAVVLYEMLIGDPPHTGSTVQGIIAKVLTDKPRSVRATRESVPEHVELALGVALAKLPADRWASAGEFADALNGKVSGLSSRTGTLASRVPAASPGRRLLSALPWALLVLLLVFTGWRSLGRDSVPRTPALFELTLPKDRQLLPGVAGTTLALSPDGMRLVYVGSEERLYVRDIADLEPRALPGTERARSPFFSPDGAWVGFFADSRLKKISLAGGAPIVLADFRLSSGASWGDDGFIVVASGNPALLVRISEEGGEAKPLPTPNRMRGESGRRHPFVLPGSKSVLYASWYGPIEGAQVAIQSVETGEARLLGVAGTNPRYASSGHLLVPQSAGTVMAVPFDLRRNRVTGSAFPVLERVVVKAGGSAIFSVADNGTMVYVEGNSGTVIALTDRAGRTQTVVPAATPGTYQAPRFSPDGRRIAFMFRATASTDLSAGPLTTGPQGDIWIYDVVSHAVQRLTFVGRNSYPEWTSDGKRISFVSVRDSATPGKNGIYSQLADGSAPAEILVGGLKGQAEGVLSRDGRYLLYREMDEQANRDIGVVDLKGDRTRRPLLASSFQETGPRLSPDGRWLAYVSDESTRNEIYVRPFPRLDGLWQVSTSGGSEPLWSASGRALYYWNGDTLISADIPSGPGFSISARRTVFVGSHFANLGGHPEYDQDPKSGGFTITRPLSETSKVLIIENWLDQVRQRGKRGAR